MHFMMFYHLFFFSFYRWRYLFLRPVVEKEPPSAGVTKEVGQPMQDVQPIPPSIPLAARDPKAS